MSEKEFIIRRLRYVPGLRSSETLDEEGFQKVIDEACLIAPDCYNFHQLMLMPNNKMYVIYKRRTEPKFHHVYNEGWR